jgi:hypothetical protein
MTGMITRYNKKSVSIVTDEGQRWNVAPQLLRKADLREPGATRKGKVITLARDDKHSR